MNRYSRAIPTVIGYRATPDGFAVAITCSHMDGIDCRMQRYRVTDLGATQLETSELFDSEASAQAALWAVAGPACPVVTGNLPENPTPLELVLFAAERFAAGDTMACTCPARPAAIRAAIQHLTQHPDAGPAVANLTDNRPAGRRVAARVIDYAQVAKIARETARRCIANAKASRDGSHYVHREIELHAINESGRAGDGEPLQYFTVDEISGKKLREALAGGLPADATDWELQGGIDWFESFQAFMQYPGDYEPLAACWSVSSDGVPDVSNELRSGNPGDPVNVAGGAA